MLGERRFLGDLIQFNLSEFDIILGMNWLTTHEAHIDCKALKVILKDSKGRKVYFHGERTKPKKRIISTMKACKMLRKGCVGYWCYTLEVKDDEVRVEDIPIVCEFPEVFPEELLGLPPQRKIDFEIELVPGTHPISKAPYRMAPTELKDLKVQLEELLQKGFIRPSVSLWGAPILFVKKERWNFETLYGL